jgi:hypothetical protein
MFQFNKPSTGSVLSVLLCTVHYTHTKKKVKGRLAGSLTLKLLSLLYPTPEVVPSFISRGAIAPSGATALCKRRRELCPSNEFG